MESKIDWKGLALTALAQYNVNADQLVFLGHSQNVTFRVDTRNNQNFATSREYDEQALFLLRIHYPIAQFCDHIWQQQAVIESELIWLTALHRDTDLVVPYPVQNISGSFITSVAVDDISETLNCTLLKWVDGSPLDTEPTTTQARRVGELMAQLHQHASLWELPLGLTRPKYDWEQLHASLMKLRSLVDAGTISVTDFAVLESVVKRISNVMTALEKTRINWGLIHADLNENNYIFYAGKARLIDFSCCGFGYYLYDIAHTLLHLFPENRRSFLSGYQSLCQLPDDSQRILEAFFLGAMVNNFVFLASQPNEHDYLLETVPYVTESLCSKYLKGEAFLFES
ncbi:phosphotransferase enzyme family protein [Nostoc sp. ChiQUE01b]|uniref:phosphotransferase enzyme family protein n=1 Tax=Nostoc sp. ChiQUE01b TaxID=3075376 RepID=UPI002AD22920|nr:phosphotransferase [Nostoc sp. ChiQUE01b]MDZ8257119.1 phosphotransferase [Nostoc sp. ChiQUE01b]